ncbi:MAG: sigma-54-dependent transcriptional regulator [Verrucomicrobiota bacterium]
MPESAEKATLLLIDDDAEIRYSLQRILSARGYQTVDAESGERGIELAQSVKPHVILLDNRMGGMSGIEALQHIRNASPKSMVILMTAYGTTQTAIEAMKYGAFDYIVKPFDVKRIFGLVEAALAAHSDLHQSEARPEPLLNSEDYKEGIVGSSEPMQEVFKIIGQVAASDVTVMITGESGTGKELVARCLFQHSHRAGKPFIAVNCAAIPDNLIESELFGHEKGSFTGATTQRTGKFELCDKGTIFLDEIGDMSLTTQTKILRALQEGEIQRVGGSETIKVDVRMIAATNKDLEKMVEERTFREDLYYRLNVVRVRLPALRERLGDVPQLVDFMLQRLHKERKLKARSVSPEAMSVLCSYAWPGNVRELENVIHRSAVMSQSEVILIKDLPEEIREGKGKRPGTTTPFPASKPPAKDSPPAPQATSEPPTEPASEPGADSAQPEATPTPTPTPAPTPAPEPLGNQQIGMAPQDRQALLRETLSIDEAFDIVYQRVRENERESVLIATEREMIRRALRETGGNQVKASALLGITRATLRKRIEQFSLKI